MFALVDACLGLGGIVGISIGRRCRHQIIMPSCLEREKKKLCYRYNKLRGLVRYKSNHNVRGRFRLVE